MEGKAVWGQDRKDGHPLKVRSRVCHTKASYAAPGGTGGHSTLTTLSMCGCCEWNFAATCSNGTRRRLDSGTWLAKPSCDRRRRSADGQLARTSARTVGNRRRSGLACLLSAAAMPQRRKASDRIRTPRRHRLVPQRRQARALDTLTAFATETVDLPCASPQPPAAH